jgi:L-threonine-O-3-phosphate decarboxylase
MSSRPEHGGRLHAAAREFGIPVTEWLDLSTGISPFAWPVPSLAAAIWQRLPNDEDELAEIAAQAYGARQALPVAGSQAAIQTLPLLRPDCRVGMLTPAYAEHAWAWQQAGHRVEEFAELTQLEGALERLDVVVVINPNNPTGSQLPPAYLQDWHRRLVARQGWLIVDEAFIDASPQHSLATATHQPGLIVLRSLGKFFGLAGARVGFVLAEAALLKTLATQLGPWTICAASRALAAQALVDRPWQEEARARLWQASERLQGSLHKVGLPPQGGTAFFQWLHHPEAASLWRRAAQQGVLLRLYHHPASLRIGLPADEAQWHKLEHCLETITP